MTVSHIPRRILREVENGTKTDAASPPEPEPADRSFQAATREFQVRVIRIALERHGGKLSEMADSLGLSRHALRHQKTKLNMR